MDAVILSAAVHATYPAELMPDALIERVLDVNLAAHIKFLRDVLPLVKDGGRIVGLSSNCADIGIPMESLYAASKAGLERFYEALAVEIAYRRIRPIVIHPGNVNTGFNETGNDYRPTGNPFIDDGYRRVSRRSTAATASIPRSWRGSSSTPSGPHGRAFAIWSASMR